MTYAKNEVKYLKEIFSNCENIVDMHRTLLCAVPHGENIGCLRILTNLAHKEIAKRSEKKENE